MRQFSRNTFLIIFSVIILIAPGAAQNLIVNPDFEVPRKENVHSDYWNSVSQTVPDSWFSHRTVDYYRDLRSNNCDSFQSYSGASCVGLGYDTIRYATRAHAGSEYVQGTLTEKLIPGKLYYLSFHVRISPHSLQSTESISAYFSTERVILKPEELELNNKGQITGNRKINHVLDVEPQVTFRIDELKPGAEGWSLVRGAFVATGGEQFLTVGFYANDTALSSVENPIPCDIGVDFRGFYCYLDAFYLGEQAGELTPISMDKLMRTDSVVCNVYFEAGSSVLSDESKKQLDSFLISLEKFPDAVIHISGYADSSGDKEENFVLSEMRAEAVRLYLHSKTPHRAIEVVAKGASLCDKPARCRKVNCRMIQ
jgi:hypothetical protein